MRIEIKRKLERNIELGYLFQLVASLSFIIPIWFAFESKYASAATLGMIYAMNHFVTIVSELPSGAMADLLGRKKTVLIGSMVQGFAWILLSQARNETWLWVGYIIDAIGIALLSGSFTALIYDSYKGLGRQEDFSKFTSVSALFMRVGLSVATFLSGWIFGISERMPYLLTGVTTILSGFVLIQATEPIQIKRRVDWKSYWMNTKMGIKEISKNSFMRAFSLYYLLIGGISWYFLYFLDMPFATEMGFDDQQRSIIFGVIYLLGAVVNIVIVRRKWSHRTILWVFPALLITGYGMGGLSNKTLAVVAIFMVLLVATARFSLLDQMANDETESKHRATSLSVLNMLVSLVYIMMSMVGGRIIETLGTPTLMLGLAILAAITIIPVTIILVEEDKQK